MQRYPASPWLGLSNSPGAPHRSAGITPYGPAMNHCPPHPAPPIRAIDDTRLGMHRPALSERISSPHPQRRHGRMRGFTLIELMVVLVIIGVLAALIVPNVINRADDARVTAARTDVNNLMQALKLYKLDNLRYPTSEQGLQALVVKPSVGPAPLNWKPYLDKLPNDPWGRPYQLLSPGIKGEVDVLSFGADGQSGGEGANADIGSWQ